MKPRKADDGQVDNVVRHIVSPNQEPSLISMSKDWSSADFVYALDRIQVVGIPIESKDAVRALYRQQRVEREAAEARTDMEAASAVRHAEIKTELERLKKPHWSLAPSFWMTAAILVLTAIGAIAAVISLLR